MIWLFLGLASANDCPDRAAAAEALEAAVFEGRVEDATSALKTWETSLGCGVVATGAQLARTWQTEAMLHQLQGDSSGRDLALRAAILADPDTWFEDLGPDLEARHEALKSEVPTTGTLTVSPIPTGHQAWRSGQPHTDGATPSGLQLVQVSEAGKVRFGQVVVVPPATNLTVSTGLQAPAPVPLPAKVASPPAPPVSAGPPIPKDRHKNRLWLGVAGTTGALAVTSWAMSAVEHGKITDPQLSIEDKTDSYNRQKAWAAVGYASGGLCAASLALHFAL